MADTICALATAPGGALGIIRISGPDALTIVGSVCRCITATTPANTVHYGHITIPSPTGGEKEILDEAMVTIFRAPHSYTGEDSVEISCHGSSYILNKVLELLVKQGCRMANPGEYTMRAFLNGKLDLSQAEAVADLIASNNRATHQLAMSQLRGGISTELAKLRDQLLHLTTLLELELDFSDHEDLEFADRTELKQLTQTIAAHIAHLAHTFETGQALKQGIPVAIVGKTNVGKSTLLNQLIRDDRAIVSDIHGTTRDTIEEVMDIQGVQFRFIDTAGIRQTTDQIEQIGIDRTYQAINRARIVLWLLDEEPSETEVCDMVERCEDRTLLPIINKIDIEHKQYNQISIPNTPIIRISAKTGQGLDTLEDAIYKAAEIPTLTDADIIVTSARQYQELQRAHEAITRVLDAISANLSGDLIAEELKITLESLATITGQGLITSQETLNNIFSSFCIGK